MRVLIVSQYFWPENFRVNDLVAGFVERGYDLTVLTGLPNYPGGKVFDSFLDRPEEFSYYQGAPVFRVPIISRGKSKASLLANYLSFVVSASTVGVYKLRGLSFDAIFVFEPSPITVGLPAIFIGKLKKAPIILWVLDLWPETLTAVSEIRSPLLLWLVEQIVRIIYKNSTVILAQSRAFVESISKYCQLGQSIEYFPNWVEPQFLPDCSTKKVPAKGPQDSFTVLFAGNLGEAQDLESLLEAIELVKNIPRIKWVFVGAGRKSEWLRVEISERRLDGTVFMLGEFDLDDMPLVFSKADAFLVSLKAGSIFTKTIPGKVQTYLTMGKPILAMMDGEGSRVIEESGAGLTCSAGDSKSLAKNVVALSNMSPSDLVNLGLSGRDYAHREFSRDMLFDRLESLFRSVAR